MYQMSCDECTWNLWSKLFWWMGFHFENEDHIIVVLCLKWKNSNPMSLESTTYDENKLSGFRDVDIPSQRHEEFD
jgi:hypothetical protein